MKIKEMLEKYTDSDIKLVGAEKRAFKAKMRVLLASEMNMTVSNLNVKISNGREIEQLKDGCWILVQNKLKRFKLTLD